MSERLGREFLTAYLQGDVCRGRFLRSFPADNDTEGIAAMIREIVRTYPVDAKRVFIGGPRAAGLRALRLAVDDRTAPAGLLLAFPVVPLGLGDKELGELAARKLRLVILTEEHDPGLIHQKDLAAKCDRFKIPNRFLIFSEKGPEYPDQFVRQIDLSLAFLLAGSK